MNMSVMLDCSRNAVFKIEEVKRFADIIAKMGYKELYLYTEDTYEMEDEPYFGYLRGKYAQTELKEVDAYCCSIGITLVPCIQVLAHLGSIFRWKKYYSIQDINDILLVGDERTYTLIDKMFATLSKTFMARKVHIGFDEAHDIGRGKYLDENGYCERYKILIKHLERVKEIADKYGFTISMWSDMFFCVANNGNYTCEGLDENILSEVAKELPEGITVTYWDYYTKDKKKYDQMLVLHKKYFQDIAFAGGVMCWFGYAPLNEKSRIIADAAMQSIKDNGVENVMVTLWGDGGGQCSFYSTLPILLYYQEIARGNTDLLSIKRKFYEIVGESWEQFMLLDLPNDVGNSYNQIANPSLYMLYNDYFSGVFDCTVKEGDGKTYEKYAKILKENAKGKYAYIFNVLYRLCDVLSVKYELGVKTRKAYRAGDKITLRKLADEDYAILPEKLKALVTAFEELWLKENKSSGIEVEHIRLGGLIQRAEFCRKVINKYLSEETKIAELEEPLLDFYGEGENLLQRPILCNQYTLCASVNPLSHGL